MDISLYVIRKRQKVKRILFFCIGLLAILGHCSCSGKNTVVSTDWYSTYNMDSYSNKGYFYYDNGYIRYADIESKQDVLICDNPDCKHDRGNCPAHFDALFMYGIIYEDDKLYFVSEYGSEKLGQFFFYQSDVNGENRKKLGTIENVQFIHGIQYYDNYILISYNNTFDDNLKEMHQRQTGIYLYDRIENKGRILFSEKATDAFITSMTVINDTVYFTYFYIDLTPEQVMEHAGDQNYLSNYLHSGLYSIQLENGTAVKLVEGALSEGCIKGWGDNLFYVKNNKLYMYNVNSKEEKEIYNEGLMLAPTFGDILPVFFKWVRETDEGIYYQYVEGDSLKEIGRSDKYYYPIAVFPDVVYAWDFSDEGNGSKVFIYTKNFLKGEYTKFHTFDVID